ncbi:hypothetical protein AKJ16_DCAP17548 [Drosera capensis]
MVRVRETNIKEVKRRGEAKSQSRSRFPPWNPWKQTQNSDLSTGNNPTTKTCISEDLGLRLKTHGFVFVEVDGGEYSGKRLKIRFISLGFSFASGLG